MKYKTLKDNKNKRSGNNNLTKGAFGGRKYETDSYLTLKVIPKSKRTPENSNSSGCLTNKEFLRITNENKGL
ncbi:MAG: hypothetical protein AABY22_13500 [Nanoarchaeota archaeon]